MLLVRRFLRTRAARTPWSCSAQVRPFTLLLCMPMPLVLSRQGLTCHKQLLYWAMLNCSFRTARYYSSAKLCERATLVLPAGTHMTVPAAERERYRARFQPESPGEAAKLTFAKPHPGMYLRRQPAASEGFAACAAEWECHMCTQGRGCAAAAEPSCRGVCHALAEGWGSQLVAS